MAKKKIPRYLGSSPDQGGNFSSAFLNLTQNFVTEGIVSYFKKLYQKIIGFIKWRSLL